jgi:PAS domain S-box-containing protein
MKADQVHLGVRFLLPYGAIMDDSGKTREQLIEELRALREVAALQSDGSTLDTLYASLVASAMDAIILIDDHQTIVEFNAAAEQIFGYQAAAVIGKPMDRLLPDRFQHGHRRHVERFGETKISSRTIRSLGMQAGRRANGEEFPLEISISHIQSGGRIYFAAILRDTSERAALENLVIRQYDSLNTLYLISMELLRRRDIKDLLQFIVDSAVKLMDASYCEILLPEGEELVAQAYTRNDPFRAGNRLSRSTGPLSWQAFKTELPAIVEDYSTWPQRSTIYGKETFHAAAAIPILIANKCIGVLGLSRNQAGYKFDEESILTATRLSASIALAIENSRLYEEVNRLATFDELTGVYNRRSLFEIGRREVLASIRYNRPLSALMLDLDHFKNINDTWGHPTGDQVLREVAREMNNQIRSTDLVGRCGQLDDRDATVVMGRYGGEEFGIFLPHTQQEGALVAAERIRSAIERMTFQPDGEFSPSASAFRVTVSIGIATLESQSDTLDRLISRADHALYGAKNSGRNCIRISQA